MSSLHHVITMHLPLVLNITSSDSLPLPALFSALTVNEYDWLSIRSLGTSSLNVLLGLTVKFPN